MDTNVMNAAKSTSKAESLSETHVGQDRQREPAATLLLDRAAIGRVMTPSAYDQAAQEAFLAEADGRAKVPPPWHLKAEAGGFHGKGAGMQDRKGRAYVCLKLNANFPGNPVQGRPTIQGAV